MVTPTFDTPFPMPRIGDTAPDFTAESTHGSITLSEYGQDSWVLLFSHPADFTPVCSTELTGFARRSAEFAAKNCKLLGISIDSVHSHLAWRENLKQILDVELNYPLIADLDRKVSGLYGMIHPGESSTVTVRAVFFIDPRRTVRALVYYPLNVGRNLDEIARVLEALQVTDEKGVATPADWKPGDKVIVPPPRTVDEVREREGHPEYERFDFYLNKTSV